MSTGKSASEMSDAEYRKARAAMLLEGRLSRYRDPPPEAPDLEPQARIDAELRARATAAGMVDLDGLKLADLSTVKIGAGGAVQGGAELMAGLRKARPYLFPKSAMDMTDAEYAKARAAYAGRR
jgi:hypothetical protein